MTDWWNTDPVRRNGDDDSAGWQTRARSDMERIASSGEDLSREPDEWRRAPEGGFVDTRPQEEREEPEAGLSQKPDRRRTLLLGAAGAAAVGVLVFTMMPDDQTGSAAPPAASQEGFLPAAGGGPSEATQDASGSPVVQAPKVVTVTALPDGSGSVGALVRLTIHNGTDEAVVVMSSMVKGDGRPAVIGEGTLAPSSRRIEPGETASGTVEFASKKAPAQVLLMDFSGNVVASSG